MRQTSRSRIRFILLSPLPEGEERFGLPATGSGD
jgi:hypothetical protein